MCTNKNILEIFVEFDDFESNILEVREPTLNSEIRLP